MPSGGGEVKGDQSELRHRTSEPRSGENRVSKQTWCGFTSTETIKLIRDGESEGGERERARGGRERERERELENFNTQG